jgi:hypothetical protein
VAGGTLRDFLDGVYFAAVFVDPVLLLLALDFFLHVDNLFHLRIPT